MDVGLGIDEEVKAFVLSLCSALGGASAGDDGRYILGDDALAVLKDIKRWLRLYDDKLSRLDVSRLLATANFVKGDLLEILASWPEDATERSFRSKVALLCVDLLTQLTWPIEIDEQKTTMHRYMHIPFLRKSQASYKDAVLHHDSQKMLRTVLRVALPALAQPRSERSPTEDTVIKVVLYFFRNVAMITQPDDAIGDEVESDISRSTTIDAFHRQDIFNLLLTICSSMHEDFSTHDVEVLDILFHILKGIDAERLFMDQEELVSQQTKELQGLLSKEKGMLAGYARHAPSRPNRFGAMLWVKRDNEKVSTIFGQKGMANEALTMAEMDKRKKWKRPQRQRKPDSSEVSSVAFNNAVPLTGTSRRHLRAFIEQFLDSSFNPLFLAVRRAMESEAPRVQEMHTRQYLYLISWFLKAECARQKKQALDRSRLPASNVGEAESFSLIATVLNQETFVLLNRSMQKAQDDKNWQDLNAGMKCFTQILLTIQAMSESNMDEDQEIAENIMNRIFYEQSTHDRIIGLLRTYKDQEFGYLDACTDLAHVFLRLLEKYSKQNVDMQVRSRRRARKKKQTENPVSNDSIDREEREAEAEDVAEAQRTTTERKFDFNKFSSKFVNQASVDTFVALLRHFQDLTADQLKRAHRFFYRVAFKMEHTTYLFRMDIIALFNKIIKGPDGLDIENPAFKEWEELVRQVFRRLIRRMQDRPAIAVELLFSKIHSTMFYLEHGYELEKVRAKPRPPAELEVKPGMDPDQQIGVAVSILINQSKSDHLLWLKNTLSSAATERKAWEGLNLAVQAVEETQEQETSEAISEAAQDNQQQNEVTTEASDIQKPAEISKEQPKAPLIFVKADNPARAEAMSRDKYLRLLLSLVKFQCFSFMEDEENNNEIPWIVPSSIPSSELTRYHDLINKFEFDPPVYEDGKSAEDLVRRRTEPRPPRAQHGSDSEGESDPDVARTLFPAGGPNIHRPSISPNRTKRRRGRHMPDEMLDEHVLEERREARRRLEAERAHKIKSELFVHESDDESDDERDRLFFEKEEERRKNVLKGLMEALKNAPAENEKKRSKGSGKGRKRATPTSADESELSAEDGMLLPRKKSRKSSADEVTNPSSEGSSGSNSPARQAALDDNDANDTSAETETETPPSSQRPSSGHADQPTSLRNISTQGSGDMNMDDAVGSGSDKENEDIVPRIYQRPALQKRNRRAGFIIDSDSDD